MKEIMIKTIKEDITYMLKELGNIRKLEQSKDVKNILMENSGLSQDAVGYIVYIKDFRPYRKMVDSLNKAYDNLNQMCRYNMSKEDILFMDNFVISLFVETGELHKLMEDCKGDYDQYRCLSDAYVRLTDKICKIERDMPRKVESGITSATIISKGIIVGLEQLGLKDSIISKNKELGLIKYQQNVVEFKGANLICDWSRNAGKTFTIAKIIELNRPKNVLYIDSIGSEYNGINALYDKFIEINKLNSHAGRESGIEIKVKTATNLKLLVYNPMEEYSSEVSVYALSRLEKGEIDRDTVFDYVFFAECLPYNVGVKAKQSISFISYNDKDEWLERFYPNCKISKIDYRPLIEVGLLSQKMVDDCKESNYNKFCNEFAILD